MSEDASELFEKGIHLFNEREFFDCHEVLEDAWNLQSEPEKQLTQGILQIAVGFYHFLRGNKVGTIKLFKRGIPRVKPFEEQACSVELSEFIKVVEEDLKLLEEGADDSQIQIPVIPFRQN